MKKLLIIATFTTILCLTLFYGWTKFGARFYQSAKAKREVGQLLKEDVLQNGDLIFHTSLSRQSMAIQLATKSEYSHCGLIYKADGQYFVLEAVQPVGLTPLDKWIARGKHGKYVVKRLKEADRILKPDVLNKMKEIGNSMIGKNYDFGFGWSDERIYCSELIWKIYQKATGLKIGKIEKLKDFDLSSAAVKQKMKERYGNHIPLNESVISPKAVFESELLTTVKSK